MAQHNYRKKIGHKITWKCAGQTPFIRSEQPATGLDWQQTLFSTSLKAKHFEKNLSHLQKILCLSPELQEFSSCPLQRSSWQQMASVTKPSQLKALVDLSSLHKTSSPFEASKYTMNGKMIVKNVIFMMKDQDSPSNSNNRLANVLRNLTNLFLERWVSLCQGNSWDFDYFRLTEKWAELSLDVRLSLVSWLIFFWILSSA